MDRGKGTTVRGRASVSRAHFAVFRLWQAQGPEKSVKPKVISEWGYLFHRQDWKSAVTSARSVGSGMVSR